MPFFKRKPKTPSELRIAELQSEVTRLEIDLQMQYVITTSAENRAEVAEAACDKLRRDAIPMTPGDARREIEQLRRNLVVLENRLAHAEGRSQTVRFGGFR